MGISFSAHSMRLQAAMMNMTGIMNSARDCIARVIVGILRSYCSVFLTMYSPIHTEIAIVISIRSVMVMVIVIVR